MPSTARPVWRRQQGEHAVPGRLRRQMGAQHDDHDRQGQRGGDRRGTGLVILELGLHRADQCADAPGIAAGGRGHHDDGGQCRQYNIVVCLLELETPADQTGIPCALDIGFDDDVIERALLGTYGCGGAGRCGERLYNMRPAMRQYGDIAHR
jgi:hypothetical protein